MKRFRIWLSRFMNPNVGSCSQCGISWAATHGHNTEYQIGSGIFVLCEECWQTMTVEERLPHYQRRYAGWQADSACDERIVSAVRSGK